MTSPTACSSPTTNDTVTELNGQAHNRLAASGRLRGPTLEIDQQDFQAGDRILCRRNQHRLGVLNGDLGTVLGVDPDHASLTVRFDRDPEPRELPRWYLHQGHIDHGYALTGHKAQGITIGRTFTVTDSSIDREWVYVAMSRGRQSNTLYLVGSEPCDDQCTHLTYPVRRDGFDTLAASLGRSPARAAAIDHLPDPAPSSSNVSAQVDLIVARLQAERDQPVRSRRGIGLAVGR